MWEGDENRSILTHMAFLLGGICGAFSVNSGRPET